MVVAGESDVADGDSDGDDSYGYNDFGDGDDDGMVVIMVVVLLVVKKKDFFNLLVSTRRLVPYKEAPS